MNRSHPIPGDAMTPGAASHPSRSRRGVRAAAATAACLAAVAAVCSLGADAASASTVPAAGAAPATPRGASSHALLRRILTSHLAAGDFVGARVATLETDGTITEVTAGTTTTDRPRRPVDADVPWNVGSVTKTFVAVVALQLAEEGRLDLDAGIDAYMPHLPGAGRMTPRQLLQSTTGLAEYINDPAVVNDRQREWTPSELIAVAEAAGRTGEPGEAYHYANTNYIVLGEIIRQVTGNSWSEEVHARIAEPLGLTHTRAMTDERPIGYAYVDGSLVESTATSSPSIGGAAGAMLSTNRDLLTFAKALTDGTLLTAESQAAMRAFVPGEDYSPFGIVHGYGLGLEQYATDAVVVNGHMGTGEAQSAFLGYDAARGTIVAVGTNVAVAGPQAIMAIEALTAIGDAR